MQKKKIPYGVSNFEKLVNDNYYFVDKTKYLEVIENLNEPNLFFLRPRKFGKSLYVSILQYYYGIEHKDKFEKLFGEYYIGKNPTPKVNSYYVLKFDFSSILTSTSEVTFKEFRGKVIDGIKNFINEYELFSELEKENILSQESSNQLLISFFNNFRSKKLEKKIYILIDEYDHFTNELISFRLTEFKEIVSRNGYVRKFYEVIKEGTGSGIVDRFFATGVTPVTLDSLTSGFNIGKDITLDPLVNEMMGFTEEEVTQIINFYEVNNPLSVLDELRKLYNGSLFSPQSDVRLYNSNMISYFFSEFLRRNEFPPKLIDPNIASDYSKIRNIFSINKTDEKQNRLIEIINSGETEAIITSKFSFEKRFSSDDFISLLFYNGLLTIKSPLASIIKFQIPNYVIKEIYWNFFYDEILNVNSFKTDINSIRNAMINLAYHNNMKGWIMAIEEVLNLLSNRDLVRFDEKYIKILFITMAHLSELYIIKSEDEVRREYPDLMYLFRKPYAPNYQFLFELKYLKIADGNKLNESLEEAVNQVKRYLTKPELASQENLKSYAVVFVGTKGYFQEVCNDVANGSL